MGTIKIPTAGMSRQEWLRLRKEGIGGSDAGAVCGLNPYASPMSVYRDKTSDETEEKDNEAMRQGRDLEDYAARRFMEATGLKVRRSHVMYKNREHPFMLADVDRLVAGGGRGAGVQNGQRLRSRPVEGREDTRALRHPVPPLYGGDREEELVHCGGDFGKGI